jgi:activator of HSP90 ATPase
MPKTIRQSVKLPAPAERLYDMYLDPKVHGAFTGSRVTINSKPGSRFRAFDDMLSGKMLYTVPKRLIVQSWRANHWQPEDLDSILVLSFWPEGDSGRIQLVHVNVADHDYQGVKEGWGKYYWKPWREYLRKGSFSGRRKI